MNNIPIVKYCYHFWKWNQRNSCIIKGITNCKSKDLYKSLQWWLPYRLLRKCRFYCLLHQFFEVLFNWIGFSDSTMLLLCHNLLWILLLYSWNGFVVSMQFTYILTPLVIINLKIIMFIDDFEVVFRFRTNDDYNTSFLLLSFNELVLLLPTSIIIKETQWYNIKWMVEIFFSTIMEFLRIKWAIWSGTNLMSIPSGNLRILREWMVL